MSSLLVQCRQHLCSDPQFLHSSHRFARPRSKYTLLASMMLTHWLEFACRLSESPWLDSFEREVGPVLNLEQQEAAQCSLRRLDKSPRVSSAFRPAVCGGASCRSGAKERISLHTKIRPTGALTLPLTAIEVNMHSLIPSVLECRFVRAGVCSLW